MGLKKSDEKVNAYGHRIETIHRVCRMADKGNQNTNACSELHKRVIMDKIGINEYLANIKKLCNSDNKAINVIESIANSIPK